MSRRLVMESFFKFTCLCLLIFQSIFLNIFLADLYDSTCWAWLIADIFVVGIFLLTLVIAHRNHAQRVEAGKNPKAVDEIKYVFIAWLVYAIFLTPRIVILFKKHAPNLNEENFLGPNLLKITLACTALIFLVMVFGFHNAKESIQRRFYIAVLIGGVSLDLFDGMDMLQYLFTPESTFFPAVYSRASLAFAVINLFMPTIALIEVRLSFEGKIHPISFKLIYSMCTVFLINTPNLVIRSLLWHNHNMNVSVLLMKNIMCICVGLHDIMEYLLDERPKKCNVCSDFIQAEKFDLHECKNGENHDCEIASR